MSLSSHAGIVGSQAGGGGGPTQNAPTLDDTGEYTSGTTSTDPHTIAGASHGCTVGAGANRRLVVFVLCDDNRTATEVKWGGSGGTSLTQLGSTLHASGSTYLWVGELLAPASGNLDLYVNLSANGRISVYLFAFSASNQVASTVGTAAQGSTVTEIDALVTPSVALATVCSAAVEGDGSSNGNTAITPQDGQTALSFLELGTPANSTGTSRAGYSAGPDPAAQVTHGWAFNKGGGVVRAVAQAVAVPGILA